jgi:protein-disulfide isomerase
MTEPAMDNRPKRRRIAGWLLVPLLLVAAVGAWLALDPGFRWSRSSPDIAADLSHDAFGQRVRAYLLEHPEVVMEAAQRFEERQWAGEQTETQQLVRARAEELLRDADSPVGRNPHGDVSLVEFFDYNCPYCRRVAPVMIDAEKADPQLRIVYKEFPILGPNSTFAAKAALAVHRQGKYLALHQALMQARGTVDEAQVLDAATRIGVDIERMKSEMKDPAIQTAIEKNLELAQALRINGTPSFVIGEQILRGAADLKALQELIGEARSVRN